MEIKTKEDYSRFIDKLYKMSSGEAFCAFSKKIIKTSKEIIGVKTPLLREMAKKIFRANHEGLFEYFQNKYFEEVLMMGLVIAQEKEFETATLKLNQFYKLMDNWAVVDMVACGLAFMKNCDKREAFDYFKQLLASDREFIVRFGVVCLMKYFLDEEWLWMAIDALKTINCDKYYVNMAIAWLMSEVLIKNPQNALENMQKIIKINHFNKFIINKSIQKACESFRIDKELKLKLKEMKV